MGNAIGMYPGYVLLMCHIPFFLCGCQYPTAGTGGGGRIGLVLDFSFSSN